MVEVSNVAFNNTALRVGSCSYNKINTVKPAPSDHKKVVLTRRLSLYRSQDHLYTYCWGTDKWGGGLWIQVVFRAGFTGSVNTITGLLDSNLIQSLANDLTIKCLIT